MAEKISDMYFHKTHLKHYCRVGRDFHYFGPKGTTKEDALKMYEAFVKTHKIKSLTADEYEKTPCLPDLVQLWLEATKHDRGAECQNTRGKDLYKYIEFFEDIAPASIKSADCQRFLYAQEGLQANSKINLLKSIRAFYNWCTANDKLLRNPSKGFKAPKAVRRDDTFIMTAEEYKSMREACKPQYLGILTVMWETGARPLEILSANCSEYNARIHAVVKKGVYGDGSKGQAKDILLTDAAEDVIREQVAKHKTGKIFPAQRAKMITENFWNQEFKRIVGRAFQRPEVTAYTTRHSFAVRHLDGGIPAETVAGWLGDTLPVFMEFYSHWLDRVKTTRDLLNRKQA